MGYIVFWIAIAITVVVVDLSTSMFMFVWMSIGALCAIVSSMLGANFGVQVLVFAIVSVISILIGYPWAKKNLKKTIEKTPLMEETYIGKVFTAEEDITSAIRIKVGGIYWTAENKGKIILSGSKFKIVGLQGNKLEIELIEGE